jgi:hypothetical protein
VYSDNSQQWKVVMQYIISTDSWAPLDLSNNGEQRPALILLELSADRTASFASPLHVSLVVGAGLYCIVMSIEI